ncbi:hypothetical protein ACSSS7_001760 [Eimeria intestinalis]
MVGDPPASAQTSPAEVVALREGPPPSPSFASENSGALANMATPEGLPSEESFSLGSVKPISPATPTGAPLGEGGPHIKGGGPSCRPRSSSSSVVSLMSEDGEAEEDAPLPVVDLEGGAPVSTRPKRAAAMRSRKSVTEATAAAATPPPVPAKYREELQQVDADITAILKEGLPSTDLLSNREAYLKVKEELGVPEGEEEAEGEGEQPIGTGLVLRIQRLLRQLCEGSPLPLSLLTEAASKALADGGPQGGAPVFSVDLQTLKVELPVLLTRRRFGLTRPIEAGGGGPVEGPPRGAPVGPLEDAAPYKLWVWESVLLDGLPVAFREAARRDRENRQGFTVCGGQTVNRRLRALEKLREALLSGVEADVAAARERVQQQLQREAAAAERKQQQENKRRQLEFARKERERERRQREEQKRQREAEREKKEREKQEEREKKEKEKEEQRLQKLQQQAEKQKEKKADPSVNRQQSLMASWLRRPAASASPGGGGPLGGAQAGPLAAGTQSSTSPSAAAGSGSEEQVSGGVVVVLDEEEQELLQERIEVSRAAEAEATAWKAAPEDRKDFIAVVEGLANCAMQRHRRLKLIDFPDLTDGSQQETDPADLLQQFLQKHASPARASLQAFVCFCAEHRRFEHKVTLQQSLGGAPDGESSSSSSSNSNSNSSKGSGYRQTAAEVRKGLTLTDYCAESLPDAPFLRTSWVALDDWKRPVRRLLMGKKPKVGFLLSCARVYGQVSHVIVVAAANYILPILRAEKCFAGAGVGVGELQTVCASCGFRLFCGVQAATCCEQWAEESCVDYERDSDDEWFECFDADDLDDAKEEEEEEEIEGDDDRDWLEDDEETRDKLPAAPAIKFEAFLQWEFTFDGDPKPNEADSRGFPSLIFFVRNRGQPICSSRCAACSLAPQMVRRGQRQSSQEADLTDDARGKRKEQLLVFWLENLRVRSFSTGRLSASSSTSPSFKKRRHNPPFMLLLLGLLMLMLMLLIVLLLLLLRGWRRPRDTVRDDCRCVWASSNRHVTKAEVERQLKQCMIFERRPEDRQRRWYATEEAARAFNLTKELDDLLQSVRAEEKLIEVKQQELAEQLKAQLAANNALFDNEEKKKELTGGAAATSGIPATTAASSPSHGSAPGSHSKDKRDAGVPVAPTGGSSKVHDFFVRDSEEQRPQAQHIRGLELHSNTETAQERGSANVLMKSQQDQPASLPSSTTQWPGQPDIASAIAAANIAASSAAAAAAAARATDAEANPQDAALAAHVAAAALLAAKLARGAAGVAGKESAVFGGTDEMDSRNVSSGVSGHLATGVSHASAPRTGRGAAARQKSAQDEQQSAETAEKPAAATPVDGQENQDQISAGKRMRKSAVPQDSPMDPIRDSTTKRVKRRPSVLASPTTTNSPS